MDLVDLVILLVGIAAALHGLLLGAATQALSFGGTAVGLVVGAALSPVVSGAGHTPGTKAALGLATLFGFTFLFGAVGREIGVRLWGRIRQRRVLARVDSAGGAVLAAAATLVVCWLVGGVLATVPARNLASEVQRSVILRSLNRLLPPAPGLFSRIQRLIDEGGFPQVFANLEPFPSGRLPLPADPLVREAVLRAGASTVKVVGEACGLIQSGSGFVVAPNLVVTNAHVVAGESDTTVLDAHGDHVATVVLFNPNLDVAVLRVSVSDPVLTLLNRTVSRGTQGAVLGYPGGGPFDSEPAAVLSETNALGRNIYGDGLTTRAVYTIESNVRPGNSGGPLVEPDGTVVGVVFARSSLSNNIGYALTSDEVRPEITKAESQQSAVGTGGCTAG